MSTNDTAETDSEAVMWYVKGNGKHQTVILAAGSLDDAQASGQWIEASEVEEIQR